MSTETTSDKYHIKKLNNEGHNYSTWAVCCQTVLEDLDIWSVINPELTLPIPTIPPSSSTSGKSPSAEPSDPANTEWHKKNKKACTVILLLIEDTPIQIVKEKCLANVRAHPRPGVYVTSRYLRSSDVSTRGHSRGTGPC